MFNNSTTSGGGLFQSIEGDISSLLNSLTTAGQNAINQTINPTPTFSTSSLLLIGGAVLAVILLVR